MPDKNINSEQSTHTSAKGRNVRTALVMLSIAAMFFAGVILKPYLFPVN